MKLESIAQVYVSSNRFVNLFAMVFSSLIRFLIVQVESLLSRSFLLLPDPTFGLNYSCYFGLVKNWFISD